MEKLTTYKPIIGDDDPYITIALRDLPTGFGFDGLVFDPAKPLTYALKERLVDVATRYYRNYEIVGETFADFRENLQLDLDLNVDTFEKMLAVYDDDIAKPTQSREIRRTYDLKDTSKGSETTNLTDTTSLTENGSITDSREETETNTTNSEGTSNNESTDYDIPLDNGTTQGTSKQISTGDNSNTNTVNISRNNSGTSATENTRTGNNTSVGSNNSTGENTKTGTEVEYWSDVGVAPNYTLLNGFLDNNRTLEQVFISFFKTDFTISEVYYG